MLAPKIGFSEIPLFFLGYPPRSRTEPRKNRIVGDLRILHVKKTECLDGEALTYPQIFPSVGGCWFCTFCNLLAPAQLASPTPSWMPRTCRSPQPLAGWKQCLMLRHGPWSRQNQSPHLEVQFWPLTVLTGLKRNYYISNIQPWLQDSKSNLWLYDGHVVFSTLRQLQLCLSSPDERHAAAFHVVNVVATGNYRRETFAKEMGYDILSEWNLLWP